MKTTKKIIKKTTPKKITPKKTTPKKTVPDSFYDNERRPLTTEEIKYTKETLDEALKEENRIIVIWSDKSNLAHVCGYKTKTILIILQMLEKLIK